MIIDFLKGAFPWILMGLAIAIITVAGKSAKKKSRKAVSWFVAGAINYAVALMMLADAGHMDANFVTWACLGSLFLCLGGIEYYKAHKGGQD